MLWLMWFVVCGIGVIVFIGVFYVVFIGLIIRLYVFELIIIKYSLGKSMWGINFVYFCCKWIV